MTDLNNYPELKTLLVSIFGKHFDDVLLILNEFMLPVRVKQQARIWKKLKIYPDKFYALRKQLLELGFLERTTMSVATGATTNKKVVIIRTNSNNSRQFLNKVIKQYASWSPIR